MSYDFIILDKLQQAVKEAVAVSIVPTLPIAFVRVTFNPATQASDGKYLELVHIPNNPTGDFWGDERNYQGLLRMILHWPKDGLGTTDTGGPGNVIASISNYFSKGLVLEDVKIQDKPNFTGDIDGGNEILYPLSLRYTCYHP